MSGTKVNKEKLSLKLMIHTKTKKIVFAETDSAFVDFIFHLLSLPLAKVVDLFKDKGMTGCLASVFKSFNSLESEYFDPNLKKDSVFRPNTDVVVPLLSLNYKAPSPLIYKCPTHDFCAVQSGLTCPFSECSREMKFLMFSDMGVPSSSYKPPGFVKAAVRYMVMDNLEVNPMTVAFLKYHDIDLDKLAEKAVEVGVKEAIEILKASLQTDAVLTTVFLGNAN